jgi:co-chaperonin GroES (HSP10)
MIPTKGKLLAEVISDFKTTPSGIILADTVREVPHCGRVISVGKPGIDRRGKEIKPCAQPGDLVHFKKQYLSFWEDKGKKYVFLKNDDITAKEPK